jgi:hypothetical protein
MAENQLVHEILLDDGNWQGEFSLAREHRSPGQLRNAAVLHRLDVLDDAEG